MQRELFVKICGLRTLDDALFAVDVGADAIGLVFYEGSPRCIEVEEARYISLRVKKRGGLVVGVFVNEEPAHINHIARRAHLDLVQLHGDESPEIVEHIEYPIIKAFRVKDALPLWEMHLWAPHVRMFLLEGSSKNYGGSGAALNPEVMKETRFPYPFILAGGLTPENVADRVRALRPFGVDVSSGVEEKPGVKSRKKIMMFIKNARSALA